MFEKRQRVMRIVAILIGFAFAFGIVGAAGLSLVAQGPVPVEGRKHDKHKHVEPQPVEPTPAPPPVRPHIEPIPDEHFIEVVDGKHPKPDKHKDVVPEPQPKPAPHVEPVPSIHTHIWIVRVILAGLVIGGIVIASIVHGRRG